ncbi:hypothetical protein ACFQZQ_02945 [Lysobacter koreensis]|uniref:Uncharacterized protein n=1 Tax=Lysobacter koreensis TaxID=266122 RepID=A0ABW2YN45_9GAMM
MTKRRFRLIDLAAILGAKLPSASYWDAPATTYCGDYRHAFGSGGDVIRWKRAPEGVRWQHYGAKR